MFRRFLSMMALAFAAPIVWGSDGNAAENKCFELRIYTPAPGKAEALDTRFRDHTVGLFKKHGMTNVGYWVSIDPADERLFYLLSYPDRATRDASWKSFMTDPAWKTAQAESEKSGKLVAKVESTFLHPTDYSPSIQPSASGDERLFELRIYTATPGNLEKLNARFRDHTVRLFAKHGVQSIGYWVLDDGQKGADNTLIYVIAHKSKEARDKSFNSFRKDPEWMRAFEASEKNAGGSLTIPDNMKPILLRPTDYSPTK